METNFVDHSTRQLYQLVGTANRPPYINFEPSFPEYMDTAGVWQLRKGSIYEKKRTELSSQSSWNVPNWIEQLRCEGDASDASGILERVVSLRRSVPAAGPDSRRQYRSSRVDQILSESPCKISQQSHLQSMVRERVWRILTKLSPKGHSRPRKWTLPD